MTFSPKDLNVLVGLNDSGKSNVLKALNLFFNNQTDENQSFDFKKDYSKLTPKKEKKAKEIIIEIKIDIPPNYKNADVFIWKKTWREGGSHLDTQKNHEFSANSKIPTLLSRIGYTYIPATKSNEYFMRLLGDLYASISMDAESEINKKTDDYSLAVQQFTNRISEIVKESTGISSTLTMPPSQMDVFRLFTFNTKDSLNNEIFLEQRGDGIKARHIPAILKFISEYKGKIHGKNSVPVTTIWGYEEPETGIELSRCFDFSEEFLEYSKEIQIFITTHSPAFYSLQSNERVSVSYINKNDSGETTTKSDLKQTDIHERIGLMPIIAPFVREQEKEIQRLKSILNNSCLADVPTLFVEGKTDRDTLEFIIAKKSEKLQNAIDNGNMRVFTSEENGGTNQMVEWAKVCKYTGFKSKLYFLFDKDEAGKKAKKEIDEIPCEQRPQNMKIQFIKPTQTIRDEIFCKLKNKDAFPYEMEHLYSIEYWKLLKDNGLVELRSSDELKSIVFDDISLIDSCEAVIENKITNIDVRETIFLYSPKDSKKCKIFKNACAEYDINPETDIFDGFIPTIQDIERHFCN